MKNKSRRKSLSRKKRPAHREPVNHPAFQMLVNSISETREEEILIRMLLQSQII